jgi:hypothetical protein
LVIGYFNGSLAFFKNTGSLPQQPVFTKQNGNHNNPFHGIELLLVDTPYDRKYASPVLIDLDDDGLIDMVIGTDNLMFYFKNIGTLTNPVYTKQSGNDNPFNGISDSTLKPALIDFDNDGMIDLFLGKVLFLLLLLLLYYSCETAFYCFLLLYYFHFHVLPFCLCCCLLTT